MLLDYVHKRDIPRYTSSDKKSLGIGITLMSMEEKLLRLLSFVKDDEPMARACEILEKILDNTKRKDIASELHLSENTVKTYTRSLYSKFGVGCREQLYSILLKNQTQ